MHKKYVIALYIRLSVEDFKTESLSIPNQKLILREKAMSLPECQRAFGLADCMAAFVSGVDCQYAGLFSAECGAEVFESEYRVDPAVL